MKLSKIIEVIEPIEVINFSNISIDNLAYNSKNVTGKTLFFAIDGEKYDGHQFIEDAIRNGANACVVSKEMGIKDIPVIKVKNVRKTLALAADFFYGSPSKKLCVVGITGTNGKTTVSFLIKHILDSVGKKTGLIGTIGCFYGGKKFKIPNTTPESLYIEKIMKAMVDSGIEFCVMEVSSHGIKMGRVDTIGFDFGILTNISRDHLNFHKTFSDYIDTKQRFFKELGEDATAIINLDDREGAKFIKGILSRCYTYGLEKKGDFKGEIKRIDKNGINFDVLYNDRYVPIKSSLRGRYNIYNILPSFAFSSLIGIEEEEIVKAIDSFQGVRGRGELVNTLLGFNCLIDYAHTPDALLNLLNSERELADGRLICVFGAGGNRDRGKRMEMGKIAASLCDRIILTSDNPRGEEILSIINDIKEGIDGKDVTIEMDREKAIALSITMAERGDSVVIAGKGHEEYQEIKGKLFPFNDREIARFYIKEKEKSSK